MHERAERGPQVRHLTARSESPLSLSLCRKLNFDGKCWSERMSRVTSCIEGSYFESGKGWNDERPWP